MSVLWLRIAVDWACACGAAANDCAASAPAMIAANRNAVIVRPSLRAAKLIDPAACVNLKMAVSLARPYVAGMTPEKDGRNEDQERAARKTLHELRHEGAELGGAVSAMAKRTATHF